LDISGLVLVYAAEFAVILTVGVLAVVLGLYRRAVRKLIASRGVQLHPDSLTPYPCDLVLRPPAPPISEPAATPWSTASMLYRRAIRAPWRPLILGALAGVAFLLVISVGRAGDLTVWPVKRNTLWVMAASKDGISYLLCKAAWPLVLAVDEISLLQRGQRIALFVAYFVTLFGTASMNGISIGTSWEQWAWLNLPWTILLFLARRFRLP
jgi:hypothetical protein